MPQENPQKNPQKNIDQIFEYALQDIREILNSTSAGATSREKLIRIGWVIGNLPPALRASVVTEAQNRVVAGIATGIQPTKW
jgi:hypothetical protein